MPTLPEELRDRTNPTALHDRLRRFLARGGAPAQALARDLTLAAFARAFVEPRVRALTEAERPTPLELPELDRRMQGVFALVLPSDGTDLEHAFARDVLDLLNVERTWPAHRERWAKLAARLMAVPAVYGPMLEGPELDGLRGLLHLIARWTYARATYTHAFDGWTALSPPSPELEPLTAAWLQLTFASAAS